LTISKLPFSVAQRFYNVFKASIKCEQNADWQQSILVLSDVHSDSTKFHQDYYHCFMQQAIRTNSLIIINGDFYDAMSGPDDKRGARQMLRDPLTRKSYFDDLVREGVKLLDPYKHNIAVMVEGNHESKVRDKHGTDLIERTVGVLNAQGASIGSGKYAGWLELAFTTETDQRTADINLVYHHGSGIGSESKMIQKCGEYPDGDLFIYGHFHRHFSHRLNRIRKTGTGQIYHDEQLILGVPGLKDDTIDDQSTPQIGLGGNASEGWSVENGHRSKPLGAWWVDFTWSRMKRRIQFTERAARLD
jgi:predicted phosphodiesterase